MNNHQKYISKTEPDDIITVLDSYLNPMDVAECSYVDKNGNGIYYMNYSDLERDYEEYNEMDASWQMTVLLSCYEMTGKSFVRNCTKPGFEITSFVEQTKNTCFCEITKDINMNDKHLSESIRKFIHQNVETISTELFDSFTK